jgi:uncharacterized membrane protein
MNDGEVFSVSEAFRYGWETLKRNLGLSIGLSAAAVAVMLIFNGLSQGAQDYPTLSMGVGILSQVIQFFITLVWIRFALAIHDGRTVQPRELVPDAMTFLNYLAVSILYGLLVVAGLVLLIIPGIYLAVRYGLAGFLVADGRTDVLGAFRTSSELTRGMRWRLLLLGLGLFALNLVGALLFGLGLLFTVPLTAFTATHVYRRLVARVGYEHLPVGPPSPMAV